MVSVILYSVLAGIVSTGLGGLLSSLLMGKSQGRMSILLSFSNGIMLSLIFLDLIPEAVELAGLFQCVIGILLGILLVYVFELVADKAKDKIEKIDSPLHEKNCSCEQCAIESEPLKKEKELTRKDLYKAGLIMVFAVMLHNLPAGLAIGAGFKSEESTIGISLLILVALHNIPEGMALCMPMLIAGMKKYKAVLITAGVGVPIVLGAALGYMLGGAFDILTGWFISAAAGAMMFASFMEIIPEAIKTDKTEKSGLAIISGVLVGMVFLYLL